jgi:hypothetical protein
VVSLSLLSVVGGDHFLLAPIWTCNVMQGKGETEMEEGSAGEEGNEEGEMDAEDVAAQVAADDFVAPQPEQPELELSENLNMDGDADEEDAQDQGDSGADVDAGDEAADGKGMKIILHQVAGESFLLL